ncbi:unnamed protein product, partial [marine sediment metagenome]
MTRNPKKKTRIGEELVKTGLITPEQLKFALEEQKKLIGKDRERLGEVIIKCGFVSEELLVLFLERYLGIPYMDLKTKRHLDPTALSLIPERMARNFKLIPTNLEGKKLHVAMANPFDIIALDTIETKTGYAIERWFSRPREIDAAIDRFYGEDNVSKTIHEYVDFKAE